MTLAAAEHGPGVVGPFLWGLLPDNERVLDRSAPGRDVRAGRTAPRRRSLHRHWRSSRRDCASRPGNFRAQREPERNCPSPLGL
ncbi:MAG: hypothetical protein WAL59_29505 [Roseiarcus sp.]